MNIMGELKARANWKKHLGKRLRKRKSADKAARKTRAAGEVGCMRLIDADALNKELQERVGPPETEDLYAVNLAIIDASTVEAVPVIHSKWKTTDAYPHWLYCLNCYKRIVPNVEWIEQYNIPTNYCPNCGAKMDGIEQRQYADPAVWA